MTIYYVSPDGDDATPGTQEQPFLTIQHAADTARPGDTCIVRGGTYRETVRVRTSGEPGRPIRFIAASGEVVTLSGADPVDGPWEVYRGSIYRTPLTETPQQVFVDGAVMVEARWPNCSMDDLWDRDTWASSTRGSSYGRMVDPALAETGINWTGATAVLNVAHEFFTWTRTVREHAAGAVSFSYDRDMGKDVTRCADITGPWEDDRYYLAGPLAALDSPAEWAHDELAGALYLWAPRGERPARVEAKRRDYAFEIEEARHVEIAGFQFFACSFRFDRCDFGLVEDCDLRFPTFSRQLTELASPPRHSARTYMAGAHNTIRGCTIAFASGSGVVMVGPYATVENNLIHDVCWSGSLLYSGIKTEYLADDQPNAPGSTLVRSPVMDTGMESQRERERWDRLPARQPGALVSRNTVFNCGNTCIWTDGYLGAVVELNHVFHGGLQCKDASLLYTHLPVVEGSVFRFNWVHGNRSPSFGLGIRGDDQTRGLTVHHNVVWDCPDRGIVVKGDHIGIFHNTVFACPTPIEVQRYGEPRKPWRNQWPLIEPQNPHTVVVNNCGRIAFRDTTAGDVLRAECGEWEDRIHHNYTGDDPQLTALPSAASSPMILPFATQIPAILQPERSPPVDAGAFLARGEALDFRPRASSPLIGAGTHLPHLPHLPRIALLPAPSAVETNVPERPAAQPAPPGGPEDGAISADVGAYVHAGEQWVPGCQILRTIRWD